MELPPNANAGLGQTLKDLISSRTVIGEPILVRDITLVPVVDVTFGFGSSGNMAQNPSDGQTSPWGTGVITGARITPRAIIVVRDDQIEVYPLASVGPVERILDRLPTLTSALIERIKEATGSSSSDQTGVDPGTRL